MRSSLGGWGERVFVENIAPLHFRISAYPPGTDGSGASLIYFVRDCLDPYPSPPYKILYHPGDPWVIELVFPDLQVEPDFQKQLMRAAEKNT